MKPAFSILFQSLVKPFYKENAGAFVFVFTMMFCIISKVDGASLFDYHYRLATGMLQSNIFLLLVFAVWFLYARKCATFVAAAIDNPAYSFLRVYNALYKTHRFRLFFVVETLLQMPVLLYGFFVAFVGIKQQLYLPAILTVVYLVLLCIAATAWHVYQLDHLNKRASAPADKISVKLYTHSYLLILIRFVVHQQATIWAGIQIFNCGVLYLIARNNNATDHDISLAFLFYSFGILANGVLIFRIRSFEETCLHFYKSLPVAASKRLLNYAVLYAILFIPEVITTLLLTPVHLHIADAFNFILCGYALLLLMNSFTFLQHFRMKDYIALLLSTFFVECMLLIAAGFTAIFISFFAVSISLFFNRYYKAEQLQNG